MKPGTTQLLLGFCLLPACRSFSALAHPRLRSFPGASISELCRDLNHVPAAAGQSNLIAAGGHRQHRALPPRHERCCSQVADAP